MFLTSEEKALAEEFIEQGYVIRSVEDRSGLDWFRYRLTTIFKEIVGGKSFDGSDEAWLNQAHQQISIEELNSFRVNAISRLNAEEEARGHYFRLAKSSLESLVGNELAMQLRINLSIQIPNDDSSLLPVHADTWSGDSPYEVVVWAPLVDCFGTKSMYLLPPTAYKKLHGDFREQAGTNSEELFRAIESEVIWLEVPYGDILIFNQGLPHGNRTNRESETRWSMNCRFKGVFTPYGDKKIGEFFEPITLRAASRIGMYYRYPQTQ
jgi:sporadic carbohydrate cluster 2OG-Fe(II) oxygenase